MEAVLSVLLFTLACNLDTLILSFTYALRGVALSPTSALLVAAITSLITGLSLGLGAAAAELLNAVASRMGALVLVGIGLWTVLDWLRAPERPEDFHAVGCVTLAAALAVNNAGVGIAAGVSGLHPLWGAAANFLVTLAFLRVGRLLARYPQDSALGRYALPLSGLLLVVLGVLEL